MDSEADRLLGSAKQFLVEALRNHEAKKNAFAILHGVTAAELVLKARLARVHPTLIRKNIDSKRLLAEHTVMLGDLPQRLANLGVALDAKSAEMIRRFATWRNEIVHHLPSYEEQHARSQVPALLDFLADYLDAELDMPLKSFLPLELFRVASDELEKWKRVVAAAVERAQAEGEPLSEACSDCGTNNVLSVRDCERLFCHLCGSTRYCRVPCSQCDRLTMVRFPADDKMEYYCERCTDAAGDAWVTMQEDMRRGK